MRISYLRLQDHWEIVYQLRNEAQEERRGEAGACCGHHRCARFSSLPNSHPPRRGLLLGVYPTGSPAFETSDERTFPHEGGKKTMRSVIIDLLVDYPGCVSSFLTMLLCLTWGSNISGRKLLLWVEGSALCLGLLIRVIYMM